MRGDPQAASARLPAPARAAARPWAAWLKQSKQRRIARREERLEIIARLRDEERRARPPRRYEMPRRLW
jgi:hypothetical protein